MTTATIEIVGVKQKYNPLRLKSYEEVLQDLARSREECAKGHYKEAGAAIKEIRARYGI